MDGVNDRYRLVGDEDCGVSVECAEHWAGGRPIIYYDSPKSCNPYPNGGVAFVHTISRLLEEIDKHEKKFHKEGV